MPAPQRDGQKYKLILLIKRISSDNLFLNTPDEFKSLSNFIKTNTPNNSYYSPDLIKDYSEGNVKVSENFISDLLTATGKDYNNLESFMSSLENDIVGIPF